MPTPSVQIKKQDGQTGAVPPSAEVEGIFAIIAPSEKGPSYPQLAQRPDLIQDEYGVGKLTEDAAYLLGAGLPVVVVRPVPSTAGAYGAVDIDRSGSSTSVPSAHTATEPLDDFDVQINIITGGTIGVDGIEYEMSVDGGESFGPKKRLGTASTIVVTDGRGLATGAQIDLAAGTLEADDLISFSVTGPKMTNADLVSALDALRQAKLPYEGILVHGLDADSTTVGDLDLWIGDRELEGNFPFALGNVRLKGASESESAYSQAMTTVAQLMASIRVGIGADGAYLPSPIRGTNMKRATSVLAARRLAEVDVAVDAARVSDGPLSGNPRITDIRGNPAFHDELMNPTLDGQRLITLRSFIDRQGVFITNPNTVAEGGSDFPYIQYVRVMNKACRRAYFLLEGLLSQGVVTVTDPHNPNKQIISESDASHFEEVVNTDLESRIVRPRECSALKLSIARDDDLTPNTGATINSSLEMVGLKYVKRFKVNTRFVRSIGG